MKFKTGLLAVAIIGAQGFAVSAMAQDEEKAYDATISLGYVGTSGNTDTQTFNTEFLLKYSTDMWDHNLKFQALGAKEDGAGKAERYYLENKSDYNLDDDQYLYGKGSYTDDRFSGFDYQATVSAGYGRHLLRLDNFEVQGFGGLGYRENSFSNGTSKGEMIVSLGERLSWQISDSSSLTQSFTTEIGEELTYSVFEIGLVSNIIDRIATKIAFQARNNSEVPAGNEKTDTQTSISLVYSF